MYRFCIFYSFLCFKSDFFTINLSNRIIVQFMYPLLAAFHPFRHPFPGQSLQIPQPQQLPEPLIFQRPNRLFDFPPDGQLPPQLRRQLVPQLQHFLHRSLEGILSTAARGFPIPGCQGDGLGLTVVHIGLTAAGQIAQDYRAEIAGASSCGRNEATLALGLSMADMKAETMISKGLVSADMAALLRGSRAQGHENALAALDQALATRESSRTSGEPKGTFAPVDRSVFQGIYDATLNAFRQNGGDGAGAIRAGASYGQSITAQATARNPQALRWGINMESYWKNFYTAPDAKEVSPLEKSVNRLMEQIGKPSSLGSSAYQKYADSWRDFLAAIGGGGLNIKA